MDTDLENLFSGDGVSKLSSHPVRFRKIFIFRAALEIIGTFANMPSRIHSLSEPGLGFELGRITRTGKLVLENSPYKRHKIKSNDLLKSGATLGAIILKLNMEYNW